MNKPKIDAIRFSVKPLKSDISMTKQAVIRMTVHVLLSGISPDEYADAVLDTHMDEVRERLQKHDADFDREWDGGVMVTDIEGADLTVWDEIDPHGTRKILVMATEEVSDYKRLFFEAKREAGWDFVSVASDPGVLS